MSDDATKAVNDWNKNVIEEFRANDGVVPLRSQVHGRVAWAGYADHLDVLGHFAGAKRVRRAAGAAAAPPHVDWLRSGAGVDEARFARMTAAIADGLASARPDPHDASRDRP